MRTPAVYVSDIASYWSCPKTVYYRRVLGIYTQSTLGQALGLLEHEARRRYYSRLRRCFVSNKKPRKEALDLIARECVEESISYVKLNYAFPYSIENFGQNIKSRLLKDVRRICSLVDSGEDRIENAIPFAVEVPLRSRGLGIAGRVDCMLSTLDGLLPVDFKTFGKNVDAPPHELQISAYAMLIEETFNSPVSHGMIFYTQDEFTNLVRVTEKYRSLVMKVTESILKLLETREMPDVSMSITPCTSCAFLSRCVKGD